MSSTDRIGLYVYAPTNLASSHPLQLLRFERERPARQTITLDPDGARIPAGIYRVFAQAAEVVARDLGDDVELVTLRGSDEPWLGLQSLAPRFGLAFSEPRVFEQFFAPRSPDALLLGVGPSRSLEPVLLRQLAALPLRPFAVGTDETDRITVYDATGSLVAMAYGTLKRSLAPGSYRVHVERAGEVSEDLVDHTSSTVLTNLGPPRRSPAPHEFRKRNRVRSAASRLSWEDTSLPLGTPPHASRLFLFVQRRARAGGARDLPALSLHDAAGRLLVELPGRGSYVNDDIGYMALSCKAEPGTYRLRDGCGRRELAITVPAGRAAQVFIVDHGELAIADARIALVPTDRGYVPDTLRGRAMEHVLAALRAPEPPGPLPLSALPPEDVEDDLCAGIAMAHLALRSRDRENLARFMKRLERHSDLPDIAILRYVTSDSTAVQPPPLEVPPLFRASLQLALKGGDPNETPSRVFEDAARAAYQDSAWCTWGPRPWDAQWIQPTIAVLRAREPQCDARSLARRLLLPQVTVQRTIEMLDAAMPRIDGAPATPEQIRVPGYTLGATLGRGRHGIVLQATRHPRHHLDAVGQSSRHRPAPSPQHPPVPPAPSGGDPRVVAMKVVPIAGGAEVCAQVETALAGVQELRHPRLVPYLDHGPLPNEAGLWFEMERCRGSVLDLVAERDQPVPPDEACRIAIDALEALEFLHQRGVVHGDLRPSNLLVQHDGRIAIADLRLTASLRAAQPDVLPDSEGATRDDMFATAAELLPSSWVFQQPGADVWVIARTLYFLLTLELPQEQYADQDTREAVFFNPVVPIRARAPQIPTAIARCIDYVLDRRPLLALPTATMLRRELQAALG